MTNYSARNVWTNVFRRIRSQWQPLVILHLAFVAMGFAFLSPLVGLFVQLPLWISGSPFLADQDILYFFLSPIGLICLVLIIAVVIAIVAAEQASMLAMTMAARGPSPIGLMAAISFTRKRIFRILAGALEIADETGPPSKAIRNG